MKILLKTTHQTTRFCLSAATTQTRLHVTFEAIRELGQYRAEARPEIRKPEISKHPVMRLQEP